MPRFLSRPRLWQTDRIAKRYGRLPSEVIGLRQAGLDTLAYDFDCAVFLFGAWFDGKAAERTKGSKNAPGRPKYSAQQLLGLTGAAGRSTGSQQRPRTVQDIMGGIRGYKPLIRKADGTLVRSNIPGQPPRPTPTTDAPRPAKPWEPDDENRNRVPPSDWS